MKRQVLVSKAAFNLRKGETAEMFLQRLGEALRGRFEVCGTREKDYKDDVWVDTRAVLPEKVIFRRTAYEDGKRKRRLLSSEYSRDDATAKFAFSEPVEVMEEKEFVPIQKRDDMETHWVGTFWDGAVPGY